MQNQLEKRQAEYDQNKAYLYAIKKSIYNLKTETSEKEFNQRMDELLW